MIKAMIKGRDAESKAQSDFYSLRGPTSGTIDENQKFKKSLLEIYKKY